MPPNQGPIPIVYLYLAIGLIFYFIYLKPQKEERKKHDEMLKNLKKNDEIVTNGGIHGTIVLVKDDTIVVRVDDNVKIEFDKTAVVKILKSKD